MKRIVNNRIFQNLFVVILILIIWSLFSSFEFTKQGSIKMWFANINEVFSAIYDILSNGRIDIYASFLLIIKSSFIVIVLGSFLGFIVGYFNNLYYSLNWTIDFWRSIPPILIIGVLINFFHSDTSWRIWLVVFGALPLMIMQIADAVHNISKQRMIVFQSLNVSIFFKIKNIIFYEILPSMFSTTRAIISFAIIIIIVSEMVESADNGIGGIVQHYQTASQIEYVYAYAIIVGFIGIFLNKLLRLFENSIIKW